jgi:ParB-like chromosome segregation protein Spo0J
MGDRTVTDYPRMLPASKLATMLNPENPRLPMDEDDFETLKGSLGEFGLVENVVVNKRLKARGWPSNAKPTVVSGHRRIEAAVASDYEQDLDVKWVNLNRAKEAKLNLVLNKLGGEFDLDAVEEIIRYLHEQGPEDDLSLTGFRPEEIADFISGDVPGGDIPSLDAKTEIECPQCGAVFEVDTRWQRNRKKHREN